MPGSGASRWRARPKAALFIRGVVVLLPTLLAVGLSVLVSRIIPEPRSFLGEAGWLLGLGVLSTVILVVADRQLRRLLPLALLLKMTLVFPDQAPSRFNSALRMGSQRQLAARLRDAEAGGRPGESLNEAAVRLAEMAGTLMAHDRRTRGHSERVRAYAAMIGTELKLNERELDRLQWAALLHDIGKLSVPAEILNKRGRPTDEEWQIIRGHPAAGRRFLDPVAAWLGPFANAAWEHHEKWDGSGYPAGLSAERISQAGRIVAVADAFEVMTATRSYKRPMPAASARSELTACAGTHFDPVVVRALLSVSLGQLRKAAGPLAWVAQLPFLSWASPAGLPSIVPALAGTALRLAAAAALVGGAVPTIFSSGAAAATPAQAAAPATVPQHATLTPVIPSVATRPSAGRSSAGGSVPPSTHPVPSGPASQGPPWVPTAGPTTTTTAALPTSIPPTSSTSIPPTSSTSLPATTTVPASSTTTSTTTTSTTSTTVPLLPPPPTTSTTLPSPVTTSTSTTTSTTTTTVPPPSTTTSTTPVSMPPVSIPAPGPTPTSTTTLPPPTTTTSTSTTTTTVPPSTTTTSTTAPASPTSLQLSASRTTISPFQEVTFTATTDLPVSYGTVTFTDNSGSVLCSSVPVTSGQAQCTGQAGLFPGTVDVVATYRSGSVYLTSNTVQITVT